jgi:hypothetical protein
VRLFAKGNRVTHTRYGPGTIASTDERYTVVEFDTNGRRTFLTTMVTLEPTSEPAPASAGRSRRRKAAGPAAAS